MRAQRLQGSASSAPPSDAQHVLPNARRIVALPRRRTPEALMAAGPAAGRWRTVNNSGRAVAHLRNGVARRRQRQRRSGEIPGLRRRSWVDLQGRRRRRPRVFAEKPAEPLAMAVRHSLQVLEQLRHLRRKALAQVTDGLGSRHLIVRLAEALLAADPHPDIAGQQRPEGVFQLGEADAYIHDGPLDDEFCGLYVERLHLVHLFDELGIVDLTRSVHIQSVEQLIQVAHVHVHQL
mmetsp:Transcript_40444/g.112432  ORF Transcript_40444/g.112432 Transcript_40444/m.112432 type:complete len:235 (+) Transcript_40444:62-766(+)